MLWQNFAQILAPCNLFRRLSSAFEAPRFSSVLFTLSIRNFRTSRMCAFKIPLPCLTITTVPSMPKTNAGPLHCSSLLMALPQCCTVSPRCICLNLSLSLMLPFFASIAFSLASVSVSFSYWMQQWQMIPLHMIWPLSFLPMGLFCPLITNVCSDRSNLNPNFVNACIPSRNGTLCLMTFSLNVICMFFLVTGTWTIFSACTVLPLTNLKLFFVCSLSCLTHSFTDSSQPTNRFSRASSEMIDLDAPVSIIISAVRSFSFGFLVVCKEHSVIWVAFR